jgi:hypothetical protein
MARSVAGCLLKRERNRHRNLWLVVRNDSVKDAHDGGDVSSWERRRCRVRRAWAAAVQCGRNSV